MTVTLGTNIASLQAQRRLFETGERLSSVFERLASGQRINRASDDAAGLAIASSLNADTRVFSQAIRNANDGLSMLNIADGALTELTNITIRLSELAEQSANGTFSDVQRGSLNTEAEALVDEYNRIVESTKFGEKDLFRADDLTTRLQLGYGTNGSLEVSLGEDLARQVGDGTFQDYVTIATPDSTAIEDMITGDFNGDGIVDVAAAGFGDRLYIELGNGDGTFQSAMSYTGGGLYVQTADIDNDGDLDILAHDNVSSSTVNVFLANGDGTFRNSVSYAFGDDTAYVSIADQNNDGNLDLFVGSNNDDTVMLSYGAGDGTFSAGITIAESSDFSGYGLTSISTGDIDGDGRADLLLTSFNGGSPTAGLFAYVGGADAQFEESDFISLLHAGNSKLIDINRDGILDAVGLGANATGTINISLGQGDGTFTTVETLSTLTSVDREELAINDLNGDGYLDIVQMNDGAEKEIYVFLGNGDGTYNSQTTLDYATTVSGAIALEDFNRDGAVDILTTDRGAEDLILYFGNPRDIMTILDVDLSTRESALSAMSDIESIRDRILDERSTIGTQTSRVSVAMSNLRTSRENYTSAASRIMDADIAEESAKLVRNNILQQTAAAVLAQANQQPALALQLLGGIG